MDAQALLDGLQSTDRYEDQIAHIETIPARPARYAETAAAMSDALRSALAAEGIKRLYSHQAQAIDYVASGRDVVVVTGTASGKSICYHAPVIEGLLRDPTARALYLFPTKALAQDQHAALERLIAADHRLSGIRAAVYDGDTPTHKRKAVRTGASIILTNPEMLHTTILPQHGRWRREGFLDRLRFVVIDELHSYRGIFGSHVAHVIRRLRRVCKPEADPQFVCCSATIANPLELAERLIGRRPVLVDDDGAPRGRKFFVLWNPPKLGHDQLVRRSANAEAQELLCELLRQGCRTIAFARSRVAAELIYRYARETLDRSDPKLAKGLRPYRGGYLPAERRQIEKLLFRGKLTGVCSTNALELGIDVGSLDGSIIVGFPGTICSTWQQAGRAGRREADAVCFLIAYDDPVDQYLMRHPAYFFSQTPEHAAVDPTNPHILASHLRCAAAEMPVGKADGEFFGPNVTKTCATLFDNQSGDDNWYRFESGDTFRYQSRSGALPHHGVDLRMVGSETYAIVDITKPTKPVTIGNVDSISARELVYPNAIYLHEGEQYLVRELDDQARIARVERTNVDFYTHIVLASDARIVDTRRAAIVAGGQCHFGRLRVSWQSVAFKRIKFHSLEMIGQEKLDLPPLCIDTMGLWFVPPASALSSVASAGLRPIDGLVGIRNLFLAVVPVISMCDRRDVGGSVNSSNLGVPTVFVYDRYPGGLGYAEHGFAQMQHVLGFCRELLFECECESGCPSCVGLANVRPPIHHDPDLTGGGPIPDKEAASMLLDAWVGINARPEGLEARRAEGVRD